MVNDEAKRLKEGWDFGNVWLRILPVFISIRLRQSAKLEIQKISISLCKKKSLALMIGGRALN